MRRGGALGAMDDGAAASRGGRGNAVAVRERRAAGLTMGSGGRCLDPEGVGGRQREEWGVVGEVGRRSLGFGGVGDKVRSGDGPAWLGLGLGGQVAQVEGGGLFSLFNLFLLLFIFF